MQAPEGAPVSSGVVVEQGESCLYVKVNCRDRRGLLGDIIIALKSMPLEVSFIELIALNIRLWLCCLLLPAVIIKLLNKQVGEHTG